MRADEHTECFMRPTIMAEPELEVAGWNYLVLKLGVIKSREWPPDITAGWAARLWSTWGFWKQSQRDLWRCWCFSFFLESSTSAAATAQTFTMTEMYSSSRHRHTTWGSIHLQPARLKRKHSVLCVMKRGRDFLQCFLKKPGLNVIVCAIQRCFLTCKRILIFLFWLQSCKAEVTH